MATVESDARPPRAWTVVARQELRDLWLGGRGLFLTLAFSGLLSVVAYLVATNQALNFLEQRESVNLTLQVAIAVGAMLALLAGADAISGERERGSLESLLLTPVSRLELTAGKLLAASSLWIAAFVVTIPYVWFLGRGIGIVGDALATGALVGTLLAIFLVSLGVPVRVARPLRPDSVPDQRAARMGGRSLPAREPADRRRALRGQDRRRRP